MRTQLIIQEHGVSLDCSAETDFEKKILSMCERSFPNIAASLSVRMGDGYYNREEISFAEIHLEMSEKKPDPPTEQPTIPPENPLAP